MARPRTLRAQLLVAILTLTCLICVVIGVVTAVALRQFLIGQLDRQVSDAGRGASAYYRPFPAGSPQQGDKNGLFPPGQPPGTVGARIVGGAIVDAAILDPAATNYRRALTSDQLAVLKEVPVSRSAHTYRLGDLGDYRLIAARAPDGAVVVTGLPMASVQDTVLGLIAIEAGVIGIGLLLAAGVATLLVRVSLRPLRRVAATAAQVAELPLDRGEVALSVRVPDADTDPRTEVGQVGAALNRMLGHVGAALTARQASETRVRQFVADASHELRTPLAAIRGYAEVTRRSREVVPPDIAHALRRVESESVRMTALVDDLLLLARIDSGRPLSTEPVDLSRLVVDAVGDAHVAGPGHRWLLDLPEEEVWVPGEANQLHQVLANLLANARTHAPPGTTVTTTLGTATGGWAELRVCDDGPGISPELQTEVFERFARGDTSRSRAAGSTGLGLAIVATVVEAHRGTVEVTSRPGETIFTVRLPAHP